MDKNSYYCYSTKLYHFLSALGFRYKSKGINKNTDTEYKVYAKSEKLDDAITLYNSVKHKFN